jgi:WAS/WASL-interacting protein
VTTPTQSTKGLRIATQCTSVDQFITLFNRFCDAKSFFVSTMAMRPVGLETAFSVDLEDGTPVLRGLGVVLDAWTTKDNPYGRPGVRLGVRRLTTDSAKVFEQLLIARALAENAEVDPNTEVDVQLPASPQPLPQIPSPDPHAHAHAHTHDDEPAKPVNPFAARAPVAKTTPPKSIPHITPPTTIPKITPPPGGSSKTPSAPAKSATPPKTPARTATPPAVPVVAAAAPTPASPTVAPPGTSPLAPTAFTPPASPTPPSSTRATQSRVAIHDPPPAPAPPTSAPAPAPHAATPPPPAAAPASPADAPTPSRVAAAAPAAPVEVAAPPAVAVAPKIAPPPTASPTPVATAPPRETRATGSPFVLPANPLMGMTDKTLEALVDCTLYEVYGALIPVVDEELQAAVAAPLVLPPPHAGGALAPRIPTRAATAPLQWPAVTPKPVDESDDEPGRAPRSPRAAIDAAPPAAAAPEPELDGPALITSSRPEPEPEPDTSIPVSRPVIELTERVRVGSSVSMPTRRRRGHAAGFAFAAVCVIGVALVAIQQELLDDRTVTAAGSASAHKVVDDKPVTDRAKPADKPVDKPVVDKPVVDTGEPTAAAPTETTKEPATKPVTADVPKTGSATTGSTTEPATTEPATTQAATTEPTPKPTTTEPAPTPETATADPSKTPTETKPPPRPVKRTRSVKLARPAPKSPAAPGWNPDSPFMPIPVNR